MKINRREFTKQLGMGIASASLLGKSAFANAKPWFDISIAEWSFHKAIFAGEMSNLDFPAKARKDFDISIVEYVNALFGTKATDFRENGKNERYLAELLKNCKDNGVTNHLIMCDREGNLGDANEATRITTVDNHKKWIDAAAYLGCKTIRVNAAGEGSAIEVAKNAADGLHKLGEVAAKSNINVIVENHGSYSSNGKWLSNVIKSVNLKNVGTLPDFGNFCIKRDKNKCEVEYDRYLGVEELMPYAFGVSAKTKVFDKEGYEKDIDYNRLMKIVKNANFNGIIGIEYEGEELTEAQGIMATKLLLEKYY